MTDIVDLTVICESYSRIGSRNLKDYKLLTTTNEITLLYKHQ